MALVSPGVQVSVIDESFYTPAEPGTVPMLFVVSAQDKANASGTGTARGTTKANAGVPFLVTSQRDLADTFGDPKFYTDSNNNPIHGGELNEYGLQTAYSFLGVSNQAFVVRADIDTNELVASATAPAADPAAGTYWFDTQISRYGFFVWNANPVTTTGGQAFTNVVPTVIGDETKLVGGDATQPPKASVGAIGDYVLTTTTNLNKLFYKNYDNMWVKVGTADWKKSHPTVVATTGGPSGSATFGDTGNDGSIEINNTPITVNAGDDVADLKNAIELAGITGVSARVNEEDANKLYIYSDGTSASDGSTTDGGINIQNRTGTPLSAVGINPGVYYAPSFAIQPHTSVPQWKGARPTSSSARPTGSIWFKTTDANFGAKIRVKVYNGTTNLWEDVDAPVYTSTHSALFGLDRSGGGVNIPAGAVFAKANDGESSPSEGDFKLYKRESVGSTRIVGTAIEAGDLAQGSDNYSFSIQETKPGTEALDTARTVTISGTGTTADADAIAEGINSAGFSNIVASVDAQNRVVIEHNDGGDFRIADTDGALNLAGFTATTTNLYAVPAGDTVNDFVATLWKSTNSSGAGFAIASDDAPSTLTADGRLWYNSIVDEVDLLIHNGTSWVGFKHSSSPLYDADETKMTDPAGPIVSSSTPLKQSDDSDLVTGDIWIDTSDIENYPTIYKFNADLTNTPIAKRWILVDKGDQTSEDGILFADARYNTSGANSATEGTIADLLVSNYLDPDAPDPALYPQGMLLWNLRRSGFNVKKFVRNYINTAEDNGRFGDESMDGYYEHRWVTESANQVDGSGTFGRKAQRKVIVQALQALLNSNEDIRDEESRNFNLMATPGYPELIGEMVTLNYDRGLTAFVLGDSPFRLASDATTLNDWGSNVNLAVEDNDNGLVTRDEYLGVFYPSLFTSDNLGNNVVVPSSHGILRTIALSDQVSFPWFAPAGTRRGGITNASAAGFVDAEGEFKSIALNEGQRDTLYNLSVNPITFLTGAGLVNYGQKTRARNASALDRINVARLVVYLRSQLNKLAKPYIFEPNDKITRDEIKQQVDSLLLELVGQRALYDFLVVCDESNNTPNRIDRNELYVDIAIEPVKAVEFIYIPLRLKNTGEIAGL